MRTGAVAKGDDWAGADLGETVDVGGTLRRGLGRAARGLEEEEEEAPGVEPEDEEPPAPEVESVIWEGGKSKNVSRRP